MNPFPAIPFFHSNTRSQEPAVEAIFLTDSNCVLGTQDSSARLIVKTRVRFAKWIEIISGSILQLRRLAWFPEGERGKNLQLCESAKSGIAQCFETASAAGIFEPNTIPPGHGRGLLNRIQFELHDPCRLSSSFSSALLLTDDDQSDDRGFRCDGQA